MRDKSNKHSPDKKDSLKIYHIPPQKATSVQILMNDTLPTLQHDIDIRVHLNKLSKRVIAFQLGHRCASNCNSSAFRTGFRSQ